MGNREMMLEKPSISEFPGGIEKICDISFEDVMDGWRDSEASNPSWIDCATHVKGWPDWESWRRFSCSQLRAADRNWERYRVLDPGQVVADMVVGPFGGWQARFKEKNVRTFAEALGVDSVRQDFGAHEKILSLIEDFPMQTRLIGMYREDNGKIVCIEGHHRATAIMFAKDRGTPINFANREVQIDLAFLPFGEEVLLDKMLERGSEKDVE